MRKLKKEVTEKADKRKKTKVEGKPLMPKNVLEAFETIVEHVRDSKLNEEFFTNASVAIDYVAKTLKLSEMESVLLSVFVDKSEDSRIRMSEIAEFMDVRTVKILQLADEIDQLVEKGYLKASRSRDDLTYRVPAPALEALRKNKPYEFKEEPIIDTHDFFDRFNKLMKEKRDDEISHDKLQEKTSQLLEEIHDSLFAKALRRYNLDSDDRLLLIHFCHLFVEDNDDNIRFHDIDNIYDDEDIPSYMKRSLRNRTNDLFDYNLIENVNEDGMARSDAFKLTDNAKHEFLAEINLEEVGKSDQGLIKHNTLTAKKLIYNRQEERQIKELSSILSEKRFKDVQTRLKDSGMRSGFCCIFYGAPGTGKTETVYQIARETGRNIMRVDVDKVKSCWVGESEKNIKALFDRYRTICKNSELAPILLFNEADAVLGTRMEGASRAVDKMENSIQNIILQQMESLEGIMLATTNLTSNLDKAFERRFLYKIKFDKPSVESRAKIWLTMLPGLKKKDALSLSKQFDLSGGEIENVVRRHTVQTILSGKEKIDIKAIEESCRLERISSATSHVKIGF